MKPLLALIVVVLAASIAMGNKWSQQNSGTTRDLYGVIFPDRNNGWAVGEVGTILHTTNGGGSWETQLSGTESELRAVAFVDENVGWAVGWEGTVLHTTDGGRTWQSQSAGTTEQLAGVSFVDEKIGYAVGSHGIILRTADGGDTWQIKPSEATETLNGVVFLNGSVGWAAGYNGMILHTTDGGGVWRSESSSTTDLSAVAFADEDNGWATGYYGTILHTTNGGRSWQPQSTRAIAWFNGVAFVDTSNGWAVGSGMIVHTTDGGNSWRHVEINDYLTSVTFADVNDGWAVGYRGTVLYYSGSDPKSVPQTSIVKEKFPPNLSATASFIEPSGNNLLDGGETANLKVSVANSGKGAAYNLMARLALAGNTKGVTAESMQSIPKLAPGKEAAVEFRISADRSVITDTVHCNVTFTEGNGSEPAPVSLTVGTQAFQAPKLAFVEAGINDGNSPNSSGNGNHIIENLETIETTCLIQNQGQGEAKNVEAHIRIGDANIVCSGDSVFDLGVMKPGDSKTFAFSFWVNNRYNGAAQLPISLGLSESYGQYGGTFPLGLEMRKVSRTASEITVAGKYAAPVAIPNPPSLVSDVDKDIPNGRPNPDAVAVVIGNSGYGQYISSTPNVDFAENDARSFRDYLTTLFGVKEGNIVFLTSATKAQMDNALGGAAGVQGSRLYKMCKPGKSDVFVFFSGHGAPGLKDQEGYLVPIDADPSNLETGGYPLSQLFRNLSQLESRGSFVATDACFSGMSQKGPLFAGVSPIGIHIDPQMAIANGVIVTAASGTQFATWNDEQHHGMLTYFLLKGLKGAADQNHDGKITVAELESYLTDRSEGVPYASRNSRAGQEQTPQVFAADKTKVIVEVK